jgi:Molybdopterin converting factor, small subunit
VRLLFFAVLRDLTGKADALLELPEGSRPVDVWNQLRAEYGSLAGYVHPPLAAVNESYVQPEASLHDGDDLVFIPPVAGG